MKLMNPPRRAFLFAVPALAALAAAPLMEAKADEDYNVRLEDVANPKTKAAVEAVDRGDFDIAEKIFAQVTKDDPTSGSAFSNLGNVQMSLGKYKEAQSSLTKAVELAPNAPVPRLNRAIAREALGDLKAAAEDCTVAISLDPKEFAAWHNRGQIQADMGDWEKAVSDYSQAADLAPGIAGYRLKQALAEWQTGNLETAGRLLRGLTRKYSNYAEARVALAALLWSAGDTVKAEDQFASAESFDPKVGTKAGSRTYAKEHKWPPVVSDALRKLIDVKIPA